MNTIIPVFIPHLGCPHQCSFCNQKKIAGVTALPAKSEIIDMVRSYCQADQNKEYELAFYGGSFTMIPLEQQKEYLETADFLLKEGSVTAIRFSTRPDAITQEVLDLAVSYGVTTIELGVQSMNDEVLALAERGHDAAAVRRGARMIRSYGLTLGLQCMPGLPGDTRETISETIRQIIQTGPDFVRIYPTVVIRDTSLAISYATGQYTPFSLNEMIEITAEAALRFKAAEIPIIRIGLQASDNLRPDKDLIAGPYHPAFGEMVSSFMFYRLIVDLIVRNKVSDSSVEVHCSYKDVSKINGQKRENIKKIESETGVTITLRPQVSDNTDMVTVITADRNIQSSLQEFAIRTFGN